MKKLFCLIIVWLAIYTPGLFAQLVIEEVRVYKYFPEKGFTFMGLFSELESLKKRNAEMVALDYPDAKELQELMNRAKVKKHKQLKTGCGAVFGTLKTKTEEMNVVILNSLILDFSSEVSYWIREGEDKEKLSKLIARIKLMQ